MPSISRYYFLGMIRIMAAPTAMNANAARTAQRRPTPVTASTPPVAKPPTPTGILLYILLPLSLGLKQGLCVSFCVCGLQEQV